MEKEEKRNSGILKSITALLSADSVSLILMIAFQIILGRFLGKEIFGEFSLAMIISTLMRTLVDLGYDLKIPRNIAEELSNPYDMIMEASILKSIAWLVSFPIFLIVGYLMIGSADFIILLLMIVPVCTASTYKAILRGLKLMNPIAIIESITNILMFAAGALVVFTYPSIALIFGIYFIFELFRSAFYYYYLKSGYEMIVPSFLKIMPISILMNLKKNISSYIDSNTKTIKILFIEHFNLLAVNFLSVFQFRTPAFILGWIAANGEVGIFSAGQRFLTLLRVIPGAVLNAMLPEFASRKRSPGNALKAFAISFLTGAAIALPLYFLSDILIRFTFDFKEAIPILQILSLTFPFVMSNHTLEAYLLACKRERFGNYGLLVSITVIAAAILLSSVFDAKTAAYSALAGEASLTVLYLIFSLKR